jgi:hypothetical protein
MESDVEDGQRQMLLHLKDYLPPEQAILEELFTPFKKTA